MSMSDPIADLLTRIRNASRAEHEKVDIPSSKLKVRLAEILKDEGFIKNYRSSRQEAGNAPRVPQVRAGNERIISASCGCRSPGGGCTWQGQDPHHPRRHGGGDPVHLPRGDDGPRRAKAEAGREVSPTCGSDRSARHVRIGKKPIPSPRASSRRGRPDRQAEDPRARSARRCTTRSPCRWTRKRADGGTELRSASARALHG